MSGFDPRLHFSNSEEVVFKFHHTKWQVEMSLVCGALKHGSTVIRARSTNHRYPKLSLRSQLFERARSKPAKDVRKFIILASARGSGSGTRYTWYNVRSSWPDGRYLSVLSKNLDCRQDLLQHVGTVWPFRRRNSRGHRVPECVILFWFGHFDPDIQQEPKLLKPNTSYTVGRKDRALLLNNKKISHDHCDFVVGPHAVEYVVSCLTLSVWDHVTQHDDSRAIQLSDPHSISSIGVRKTKISSFRDWEKSCKLTLRHMNLCRMKIWSLWSVGSM